MTKTITLVMALALAVPLMAAGIAADEEPAQATPAVHAFYGREPLTAQEQEYAQKARDIRTQLRQVQRDLWSARTTETDPAKLQPKEHEVSRLYAELNQLKRDNPQAAAKLGQRFGAGGRRGIGPDYGMGRGGGPGAMRGYGRGARRGLGPEFGMGPGAMRGRGRDATPGYGPGAQRGYGPRAQRGFGPGWGQGASGSGKAWQQGPQGRGAGPVCPHCGRPLGTWHGAPGGMGGGADMPEQQ